MSVSCVEEQLANTLMKNRVYRFFFMKYTQWFDLKNIIIRRELKRAKNLKELTSPRVLEAGFGFGQSISYLLELFPKANVLGLELSDKAVTFANKYFSRRKYPNVYCMKKDIVEFKGNAAFDMVFAFKVLSYIEDDKAAIKSMFDSLKPKGSLLVFSNFSPAGNRRKVVDNIRSLPLVRVGYTLENLRDMLKEAGFPTVKCRYIYGHTGQLAWKISIGIPVNLARMSKLWIPFLPLYMLLAAPFALLLNYYDMHIGHTSGHSIFLRAEK